MPRINAGEAVVVVSYAAVGAVVAIPGPPGQTGPPGAGFYYLHTQAVASAGWMIVHNLGLRPNVSVLIGEETVGVPVTHIDVNTAYISFSAPQTGKAVLS